MRGPSNRQAKYSKECHGDNCTTSCQGVDYPHDNTRYYQHYYDTALAHQYFLYIKPRYNSCKNTKKMIMHKTKHSDKRKKVLNFHILLLDYNLMHLE